MRTPPCGTTYGDRSRRLLNISYACHAPFVSRVFAWNQVYLAHGERTCIDRIRGTAIHAEITLNYMSEKHHARNH